MHGRLHQSLSLRRAWIEITKGMKEMSSEAGRSPYGERGLKWLSYVTPIGNVGRSPYGERGLKSVITLIRLRGGLVALLTESVD